MAATYATLCRDDTKTQKATQPGKKEGGTERRGSRGLLPAKGLHLNDIIMHAFRASHCSSPTRPLATCTGISLSVCVCVCALVSTLPFHGIPCKMVDEAT